MSGGIDYLYRYFALREDLDSGVTTAAERNRQAEDAALITNFWNAVDADGSGTLDATELGQVSAH